ncbi:MAG: hypothetical protein IJF11_02135 [Clostridia bacterium]|nr:hypothetical protein [Clostridia bacterium]
MKKIFLKLSFCIALAFLLCLTAFAFEIPPEYEGTQYGASYDTSHESNECCNPGGTGSYLHYEKGYTDGFTDGYQSGLEGNELSEEEKQAFLEEYLNSEAYAQAIASAQNKAIEDYKASQQFNEDMQESPYFQGAVFEAYNNGKTAGVTEYKSSQECEDNLYAQYESGVSAGFESGYTQGYNDATDIQYDKGVADGLASFRDGAEYKATLQAQYDGGYNSGYNDGSADALNGVENNGADWSTIVSLVLTILSAGLIFVFVSIRKKGKNRK